MSYNKSNFTSELTDNYKPHCRDKRCMIKYCYNTLQYFICWIILKCAVECPRPQKPWNGRLSGGYCDRNIGSECRFECRNGFRLVGSRIRVCRDDGTWSGRTAACEADSCNNCNPCGQNCQNNCASLYQPDFGYMEGECSGIVGRFCTFSCQNGYRLDGPSRLTCLSNGQWDSRVPYCQRRSGNLCQLSTFSNGDFNCNVQSGLTICRINCHPGHILVGSSVVTCTASGSWSDQIPSCRRSSVDVTSICPRLVASDGGRLLGSCSAAISGDTCQLVCISGYRPTETRVLVCQPDGQWSNSLPHCVTDFDNECPRIEVFHGTTSGNCFSSSPGQICTINCEPGYTLTGQGTLVCQPNGQWSADPPICTAQSCRPLEVPLNGGNSGYCDSGTAGQSCNFYCDSGFQILGSSVLTCGNDGQWSGIAPRCERSGCSPLFPPEHGSHSGSCEEAYVGQTCTFSCDYDHIINGQTTLQCQGDGTWSGISPICEVLRVCPDLDPPDNGGHFGVCRQTTIGETCSFSCQEGYTLSGAAVLTCQDEGRWSSQTPICIRSILDTCPSLVAPNQGYMLGTCSPGRVGESCVFACEEEYVLRGQRTLTCQQNGIWSDSIPRCEKRENLESSCPVLTPPPHANFEECDNRPGGQCVLICEPGFLRTGSRVRTCLSNGVWSGFSPTCTQKVGYKYTYKVVPLWSLVFG